MDFGSWGRSLRGFGEQLVEIVRTGSASYTSPSGEDNGTAADAVLRLTNENAWGASPTAMHELVDRMSRGERDEIYAAIRRRWEEDRREGRVGWRAVYKTLVLYEYLLLHCTPVHTARLTDGNSAERRDDYSTLTNLAETYFPRDGKGNDCGSSVRVRAAAIAAMLRGDDEARALAQEARTTAAETRRTVLQRRGEAAVAQDASEVLAVQPPAVTPSDDPFLDFDDRPAVAADFSDFQSASNEDPPAATHLPAEASKAQPPAAASSNSLEGFLAQHSSLVDF